MKRQFTGRSVAEASIKACEALGLTRSELKHELVSQTGEALARKVVIAVEVSEPIPSAPTPSSVETHSAPVSPPAAARERAPRKPRAQPVAAEPELDEIATPAGPAIAARTRVVDGPARSSEGGRRNVDGRGRDEGPRRGRSRSPATAPREARGKRSEGGERSQEPRPARQQERSASASAPEPTRRRPQGGGHESNGIDALLQMHGQPDITPEARPVIESSHPSAERALGMVRDLLTHMGLELKAQLVAQNDEELHIDLVGKDESKAIGRKGEVLLALQFIVGRMLGRSPDESMPIVVLDAGGYRERRRQALASLAQKLAERAIEERKAVRLSPMSAHDRRIFHVTLKQIEGITSRSEGDGAFRSLLIVPSEFC